MAEMRRLAPTSQMHRPVENAPDRAAAAWPLELPWRPKPPVQLTRDRLIFGTMSAGSLERSLEEAVESSPVLRPVLDNWGLIDLPDCWLVAGAVAQTVWNQRHGFASDFGISDIDLIYHDAADLSEESEADNCSRINQVFQSIPIRFDVKNEARVHLWYATRFGHPIDRYKSSSDAIATFPTTAGAVGICPSDIGIRIFAPFGLDDLFGLMIRPNKVQITRAVYEAKVDRWRSLWPKLTIYDWGDG